MAVVIRVTSCRCMPPSMAAATSSPTSSRKTAQRWLPVSCGPCPPAGPDGPLDAASSCANQCRSKAAPCPGCSLTQASVCWRTLPSSPASLPSAPVPPGRKVSDTPEGAEGQGPRRRKQKNAAAQARDRTRQARARPRRTAPSRRAGRKQTRSVSPRSSSSAQACRSRASRCGRTASGTASSSSSTETVRLARPFPVSAPFRLTSTSALPQSSRGRKTRRACRSRASSCSRRAVSSVSSAGYRRRPSGSKTRTWRLSGPSGTRARASSILSSAAASGMASGRTGSRTMTAPGCQLRGESCTRAWRMQENCSSCRASSVSRSWRRATALSLAEHAPFPCKDKPPKSTVSSRKTNAATATAACRARPVALWRS